jgi:hypothetical protein
MPVSRSTVAIGILAFALGLVTLLRPTPVLVSGTNPAATDALPQAATTLFPAVQPPTKSADQTKTLPTLFVPPVSQDVLYLRQVFTRFSKTRSFRADLRIPTDAGQAAGQVTFVRDQGLYGILDLPQDIKAEVLMRQGQIFFRAGTSSWINLSDQPEGKQMLELFQKSLAIDETAVGYLPDHAVVTAIINDPEGCRLYTVDQSETVAPHLVGICVKNEMPVRLTAETDNGPIEVRYRDFNANLTLPVVSLK